MTDTLLPAPPAKRAFDGETYEPERDHIRLKGQLGQVFALMKSGGWWTLHSLKVRMEGDHSEAAISARIRDFRKKKYGKHTVERRSLGGGLFEYRLVVRSRQDTA